GRTPLSFLNVPRTEYSGLDQLLNSDIYFHSVVGFNWPPSLRRLFLMSILERGFSVMINQTSYGPQTFHRNLSRSLSGKHWRVLLASSIWTGRGHGVPR